MRSVVYIILIILTLVLVFFQTKHSYDQSNNSHLIINEKVINVEIVDTPEKTKQGLSNREMLGENNGMLFVFPEKQERNFWMKNMNFSIDIIWINDDTVLRIDKNLKPEGENPENHYMSGSAVNYVLEVNAGFSEKNNIKTGDKVLFNL